MLCINKILVSAALLAWFCIPVGAFAHFYGERAMAPDSLSRYHIKDSTVLRDIISLSDSIDSIQRKKYVAVLFNVFDRLGLSDIDSYHDGSIMKGDYGSIYGWAEYRGLILLLACQKVPWLVYSTEKEAIEVLIHCHQEDSKGNQLRFKKIGDTWLVDEILDQTYLDISSSVYSMDKENYRQRYDRPKFSTDYLSFDMYKWKDDSLITQMETLTAKTTYPFYRPNERRRYYTLRVVNDEEKGETCFVVYGIGVEPLTEIDYSYLKNIQDLAGIAITEHFTFFLRGNVPLAFFDKLNQRKTILFKTVLLEEILARNDRGDLGNECFIFPYDGNSLSMRLFLYD